MSLKILVPACWILWSALLLFCLFGMYRVLTERAHSPEVGRGLGVMVVGLLLVIVLGLGFWLHLAARHQSVPQLATLAVLLAVPGMLIVVGPAVLSFKRWRFDAAENRIGDFREAGLDACAQAIDANDAAALRSALGAGPVPSGTDRAGHGLLAYAVRRIAEGKAGADILRVLLEAGAEPTRSFQPDGQPLLHTLLLGRYWGKDAIPESIALLLDHGVDPNEIDPTTGDAPLHRVGDQPDVVRLLVEHGANIDALDSYGQNAVITFAAQRKWDAAIYLIERGTRLDIVTESGVSLDYYLKSWQTGVFNDAPEGWERLRNAIAQRRAGSP